jgi:hypothetical protein
MTPQMSQTDTNLQAELDRLTYSAYLLTLDPGKAFSAVERAIDGSLEETTVHSDLLERTVDLALEDVLCESRTSWDGEASAHDVVLYGHFPGDQLKGISIAAGSERQPHSSARCAFPHSLRYPSPAGIQDKASNP